MFQRLLKRRPHKIYVKKNRIEGAGCSYTQSEDNCYACEQEGKRPCPYKEDEGMDVKREDGLSGDLQ
jgi:hypothetical protein